MTLLCPALATSSNTTRKPLPPFIVYFLGTGVNGKWDVSMFRFITADSDAGDVYIVVDADAEKATKNGRSVEGKSPFQGVLGKRQCLKVHNFTAPTFNIYNEHYSSLYTLLKVDVLSHLPLDVSSAIILDRDTFIMPNAARKFADQLEQLGTDQFLLASSSGVRDRAEDGTLFVPQVYGGINGGVIGIDIPKFRTFIANHCSGAQNWWSCVAPVCNVTRNVTQDQSRPIKKPLPPDAKCSHEGQPVALLADQSVWMWLLNAYPQVWRELPCGFHVETQVPSAWRRAHRMEVSNSVLHAPLSFQPHALSLA